MIGLAAGCALQGVEIAVRRLAEALGEDPAELREERGDDHAGRDRRQQDLPDLDPQKAVAERGVEQHEGELTALGEDQGDPDRIR